MLVIMKLSTLKRVLFCCPENRPLRSRKTTDRRRGNLVKSVSKGVFYHAKKIFGRIGT